ncbi:hypothetical protein ACFX11_035491 [Malus domestica]
MATPAGGRPLKPVAPSHAEEKQQANQQKPRVPELEKHLAGNLASKKELLTGMRFGIALKMKDSLLSRSSLLMCQMSWHLQNRNNHQLRKQKLPQLRVQQPLLHLKLMLSQKGLKVRMPRLLKMEQHMIKMRTSQQKVLRTVHLPAVLLDDMDQESNKDHYFSGPGEFGLNPIRTGS